MKKTIIQCVFLLFSVCAFASQTALSAIQKEFVLEGIDKKNELITSIEDGRLSAQEVQELLQFALQFALEAYTSVGTEPRLCQLAETAITACSLENNLQLLSTLTAVFRTFTDESVRSAVLEKILSVPQESQDISQTVSLINAYLA